MTFYGVEIFFRFFVILCGSIFKYPKVKINRHFFNFFFLDEKETKNQGLPLFVGDAQQIFNGAIRRRGNKVGALTTFLQNATTCLVGA